MTILPAPLLFLAPGDPNRVWASAQSCIQRCHNSGCVPLDCRYLGSRDFPGLAGRYGMQP